MASGPGLPFVASVFVEVLLVALHYIQIQLSFGFPNSIPACLGHVSVFPPSSSSMLPLHVCVFELSQDFPVHLCQPSTMLAQLSVHWHGLSLCFEEGVLEDQPSVLRSLCPCRPCAMGS